MTGFDSERSHIEKQREQWCERHTAKRDRKKVGVDIVKTELDPDTRDKLVIDGFLDSEDLSNKRRLERALGYCLDYLAFNVTR